MCVCVCVCVCACARVQAHMWLPSKGYWYKFLFDFHLLVTFQYNLSNFCNQAFDILQIL